MPRKMNVEIDDLVKLHANPNHIREAQSTKSKNEKVKSKPQKKTAAAIKSNQLENIEINEISPSCSYELNSSKENYIKALIDDISIPQSEDSPLNVTDPLEETFDEMYEIDVWEQFTILHTLHRKETELKTAVLCVKLKQDEEFITDESLLKEKMSKLEDEIQKRKMDFKLKEAMCSEGQFMETLTWICLPRHLKKDDDVKEVYDFSDSERGLILGHLLRKEQLKKELSSEQKKIAKMEENCWKMNIAIEKCGGDSSEQLDISTIYADNWEELECLKTENLKRNARIQLFAKLVQHLIHNIKCEHNLSDDLKILDSTCERIQHWNYDNLEELEELCKKVHSLKIDHSSEIIS